MFLSGVPRWLVGLFGAAFVLSMLSVSGMFMMMFYISIFSFISVLRLLNSVPGAFLWSSLMGVWRKLSGLSSVSFAGGPASTLLGLLVYNNVFFGGSLLTMYFLTGLVLYIFGGPVMSFGGFSSSFIGNVFLTLGSLFFLPVDVGSSVGLSGSFFYSKRESSFSTGSLTSLCELDGLLHASSVKWSLPFS